MFSQYLENELPEYDSLDEYLDAILPLVGQFSEDLSENEFYLNKRWLEFRDHPNFHESVLHLFQDKGEYLISTDGNVAKARWKILEESNLMMLEKGAGEFYELAFLNDEFFILSKHGDQSRKKQRQYLVLGYEASMGGLSWKEYAEKLFYQHQTNKQMVLLTVIGLIFLSAVLFFYLSK